ncbi:phage major capsid protein [Fructilactobacillus sp. Tb1]|uniref:phage major capsid protein n=1 Tax=Fructilactobacillus sp. Tb1 TaxID=3422304 RepID=UPI003D29B461
MNINALNDAWIASGQKVSDLATKMQAATLDDNFDKEEFAKLSDSYKNAIAQRKAAKETLDIARANQKLATAGDETNPIDKNADNKITFVDKFVGMVRNDPKFKYAMTSNADGNGNAGLTIPFDQQTAIHTLKRQYDSLEPLVNIENVTIPAGSRVYEKQSDITPFANLDDESGLIGDNDDPVLSLIKYQIHRYVGISTITNTLLNDTKENILSYLNTWIARKDVVTRNNAILSVLGTQPKKPTIAKFDDVKDVMNTELDPAIVSTSSIITNVSGFNTLSKVKDGNGDYLMQSSVTNPAQKQIDGKNVVVIADRWLPDNSGSHPFIFGDLKQGVTLFDRQQMTLLSTNVGDDSFRHDTTKIRVIDRFDVQLTDSDSFVMGSFKNVADNVPVAASTGTDTSNTGK